MIRIDDNKIDFVFAELEKRGLTDTDLRAEVADHILCLMESDIENANDFKASYYSIINNLDKNIFKNIQHKTMLSTNLKYQRMKKTMFVFGIIGSVLILAGAYFKTTLTGGGALSIGLLLILLGFLPLFFYTVYKERSEKSNGLLDLTGYICVTLFLLSVLFSNQHWPGAYMARTGSVLIAIFIFTPLYLVTVFRKANETKTSSGYLIIIVLIAIGGLYLASSVSPSKSTLESYSAGYSEANRKFSLIKRVNDSIYKELAKKDVPADVIDKVNDLRKITTIISYRMDNLQNEMVRTVDGDSATTTNFTSLSNNKAFFKVLYEDRKNSNISNEVMSFHRISSTLCPSIVEQNIIDENLNINYLLSYYIRPESKNVPLIAGLLYLTNFKLHLEMAEYQVLKSIAYR